MRLGYACGVLWQKTWRPEIVLALMGGIAAIFFIDAVVIELLRHAGVAGFHTVDSAGSVLLLTLGQDGAPVLAGILFLKFHGIGWREISGLDTMRFTKQVQKVILVLALVVPVMAALKVLSTLALEAIDWPLEDQRAVELLLAAKSTGMKIYLAIFAMGIAPCAEEIIFRGFLFSLVRKLRSLIIIKTLRILDMPTFAVWLTSRQICRLSAYVGVSFLFALIHNNAPIFLPLFVFALALTWLYETTGGLLAPIMAHGIFNAGNLAILFVAEKYHLLK